MTRVALVTESSEFERFVRSALPRLDAADISRRWRPEYHHIDPTKVVQETADADPEVVVIGPALESELVFALAEAFDRDHPEFVVVLAADPEPELWQQAMRVGVRDIIPSMPKAAELVAVLNRSLETAERRRLAVARELDSSATQSRVIAVVSPKGGSGKTTVATNLGVALSRAMPGKVAIVDLDLQFGDVAAALHLQPEQTIGTLARTGETLDGTMLKVFLTPHPSGLFAICSPESLVEAEEVSYEHSSQTIQALAADFPVVIVDTAAGLDEHALAAIEHATDVMFVCTMDVASVRSLRKEIDALERLDVMAARRHFVLNRADARVGLDVADVEAAVGMKVDVAIPSSRVVPVAMNQGSPVVEGDPRSGVARQLEQLAGRFLHRQIVEPPAPARWGRRRGVA